MSGVEFRVSGAELGISESGFGIRGRVVTKSSSAPAYCLLPTAYCLLPTAPHLPPTTYPMETRAALRK